MKAVGTGTTAGDKPLGRLEYELHEPQERDVVIDVHYCGVCHSDIHAARDEWPGMIFPMVPGHEATGVVKSVGSKVTKFKVGDHVGVGVFVGSCRDCKYCNDNYEPLCSKNVLTYSAKLPNGHITYGGYGKTMVVDEHFVFDFSKLDLAKAAPILCAGITVFSAIKDHGFDVPGKRIGIIGLGGLGHMAVLLLKGMGVDAVVISRSIAKKEDSVKLGAVDFIVSADPESMKAHADSLDGIVDTVSAAKDWTPYLSLLKRKGILAQVGIPATNCRVSPGALVVGRKQIAGSGVGGVKRTEELIAFCSEKQIYPWTELITADRIEEAFSRTVSADIKYRFVLDVKNSWL